ncbi:MAG: hypothetical protein A3B44_01120 [Candidatus Levybacteria bacterium RIFCSPLOWO2_01_FULL_38_21]|nr:MAG: hypothetical protein A3B44_01120 [Candidatus Levybacteria bacterium RIFCSPLOWO2_01_FULL_38_21]
MKVGIIGPIWLAIPPHGYGGTEDVVYNLVNGLFDRGNDVTLFGSKTSKVKAKVIPTVDKPLRDKKVEWTNVSYIIHHITEAFDRASDFDILHMHLNKSQDYIALPLAKNLKTPVLFTIHFKVPSPSYKEDRYLVLTKYKNLPFTSISNSQRDNTPLNFIATVYNCLDIKNYPFSLRHDDYFVWLGKVNPVKGTKEAILAAKKARVKLYVMGAVDPGVPAMLSYYEEEVRPLLDEKQIIWKGEVSIEEKAKILGGARGLLNPILWEEPFGLVMAEAMACGTPVISFNRGAAPEIITDGKTGFLVNTLDEMVDKMGKIDQIQREECRKSASEKFTIQKMVEGYEKAYKMTIDGWEKFKK